jgi:hypothetical protein
MLAFTVDPRDGNKNLSGCSTCCCESASVRPGEINKWQIFYGPWSIPIGGRGLNVNTVFSVEKLPSSTPAGAPVVSFSGKETDFNTPLDDTVATSVTDPDSDPLTFELLPLYGPNFGTIEFNADGTYVYTPNTGFTGYDSFYYQVTDGNSLPRVGEVSIAVSPASPASPLTPKTVGTPVVRVLRDALAVINGHSIQFPVEVSPAALPGDIYRMTVRQPARDCEGIEYWHVSCYDLVVGKC